VASHLRELGFGYRAKYIAETASIVSEEKPRGWLGSLGNPENPGWATTPILDTGDPITYKKAQVELLSLSGVGPKVADCVCLMGLGWAEAVPVDTHVWQIAQRDYHFGKAKTQTLTKVMYDSIGDHFRKIWGPQAGWAQSVLFTANLKSFSEQAAADPKSIGVITEVKQEMKAELPSSKSRKRQVMTVVEHMKVEEVAAVETKQVTRKKRKTRS
jgi:N-glycosylase/DNA lyase